jgi:uncharacterized membrane protein
MSIAWSVAIRPRVLLAALAGVLAAFLLPGRLPGSISTAIAGDIAALVYLALGFHAMVTHGPEELRERAAKEDDGAIVILIVVLVAIAFSFWTIFGVLSEARNMSGAAKAEHTALAGATLLLSWLVTQTVFTFHYAHEYYRPDDSTDPSPRGLDFPQDPNPDYWDFFYFATSIGAASQTSDVAIRNKALRRIVTLHAIVSFFFNTAVLALAINIGASLIS